MAAVGRQAEQRRQDPEQSAHLARRNAAPCRPAAAASPSGLRGPAARGACGPLLACADSSSPCKLDLKRAAPGGAAERLRATAVWPSALPGLAKISVKPLARSALPIGPLHPQIESGLPRSGRSTTGGGGRCEVQRSIGAKQCYRMQFINQSRSKYMPLML